MTTEINADLTAAAAAADHASSLGTAAARNLATTTKSVPQMQGISSRWLLKVLPWVEVAGGTYRVNRRLSYTIGDGRIQCVKTGARVQVIPQELGELPLLKGYADNDVLAALADRFVQTEYAPGDMIVAPEQEVDRFHILAHGKVDRLGAGKYGHAVSLGVLSDGAYFGEQALVDDHGVWEFGFRAVTPCVLLSLTRRRSPRWPTGPRGCAVIWTPGSTPRPRTPTPTAKPRSNSPPGTRASPPSRAPTSPTRPTRASTNCPSPRRSSGVHSRVADLYNEPMNQVEQQLRLTVEALRERQEHEIINNREFGLLHNADHGRRISTRSGPPTPDDLDDLLAAVWKEPSVFLAHPRAIAAFGRECPSRVGLYPSTVNLLGREVPAWRGVPIFSCNKLPISDTGVSSMILMRTGEEHQGVVGLHQTGLPDEYEPGLNVRFMGVNEQAIISYLVSAYYGAAVLVPDALGVLENVELRSPGLAQCGPSSCPTACRPWPPRLNPHVEAARAHNRVWAVRHGLIDDGVWDAATADSIDLALFAAYCFPDATSAQLDLLTDWYFWGFYFDDWFLRHYKSTGDVVGAAAWLADVRAFIAGRPVAAGPEAGDPVQATLAELWARTVPGTTEEWRRRFGDNTFAQMDDAFWELGNLAEGRVPNPIDYLERRRGAGAGRWVADLIELVNGTPLPDHVWASRPVQVMRDTFTDAQVLLNDVFSYQRETEQEGELNNFVLVLRDFLGMTPQEAADTANDLITSRLLQFGARC